jgi:bidirectional [NiFe] hydrogenase diaphorase subunit
MSCRVAALVIFSCIAMASFLLPTLLGYSATMIMQRPHPPLPNHDKRWKMVNATMRRAGYADHALIEALHSVQEAFGFIDDQAMRFVADSLDLPLSKVYGVATFYHLFMLKPQGRHTCVVCTGTACYIKGSDALLDHLEQQFHVKPGETTPDQELSILTARCVGACGLAPAVVIDGDVSGKLDHDTLIAKLQQELNSSLNENAF